MNMDKVIASVEVPKDFIHLICTVANGAPSLADAIEHLMGRVSDIESSFSFDVMPKLRDDFSSVRINSTLTIPEWNFVIDNLIDNTYGLLLITEENVEQYAQMDFQRPIEQPSVSIHVSALQRWLDFEGKRYEYPERVPAVRFNQYDPPQVGVPGPLPFVEPYRETVFERNLLNAQVVTDGLRFTTEKDAYAVVYGLQELVKNGHGWTKKG